MTCLTRKTRTHKSPKKGLGLRTDDRTSTSGNLIQSKSMVEAPHRHVHRIENKRVKLILKRTSSR